MASLTTLSASLASISRKFPLSNPKADNRNISSSCNIGYVSANGKIQATHLRQSSGGDMSSVVDSGKLNEERKKVWIWTDNKEVMTAAVERGWNTFLFTSQNQELAKDWSSIAFIDALFIEDGRVIDSNGNKVAAFFEVSAPEDLKRLRPDNHYESYIVVDLLDWQVIPAENIVAEFQGSQRMVFAVSKTPSEAQMFLEALEHGLGGVVLKSENVKFVLDLKGYFDRRNEVRNRVSLCKASVTSVHAIGMGDRVCVDLCSLMRPGEGLLVGSFARGLFLVHSECLESNYIASRPFRVNAFRGNVILLHKHVETSFSDHAKGPVHAYVAVPGGQTSYLSELKAGKEVIVVDQEGKLRTAIVGRVKIESRPLILVEAKLESDDQNLYSILLQNAETVSLVCPRQGKQEHRTVVPVTALKAGDEVLLRVQGGARHTGIEIQEFIVEK